MDGKTCVHGSWQLQLTRVAKAELMTMNARANNPLLPAITEVCDKPLTVIPLSNNPAMEQLQKQKVVRMVGRCRSQGLAMARVATP